MKKKLCLLLSLVIFWSNFSKADSTCDWTLIKKNSDSTYTYTESLHLCVGRLVEDNKAFKTELDKLTKAIDLKNVALTKSDERADLWMNTSFKLEDRVQTLGSMQKTNELLYFGLGALTIFASGIMASKLINH